MLLKNPKAYFQLLFFLIVIFLLRIFLWIYADLDLGFDEAQYWTWSKNLEWGYYSKPPFLAWLINSFTSICGNSEICIRISSPILHTISAFFIALTAFNFSKKYSTGFIAASIWILVPGISLSSGFISTDVPLLFFSSIVLWSFSCIILSNNNKLHIFGDLSSSTILLGGEYVNNKSAHIKYIQNSLDTSGVLTLGHSGTSEYLGLNIKKDGNVGIGKIPDNYAIDISGSLNFTGSFYQNNSIINYVIIKMFIHANSC